MLYEVWVVMVALSFGFTALCFLRPRGNPSLVLSVIACVSWFATAAMPVWLEFKTAFYQQPGYNSTGHLVTAGRVVEHVYGYSAYPVALFFALLGVIMMLVVWQDALAALRGG